MTSRNKAEHSSRRRLIVGGHDMPFGRYPYFVSIDKNNGVIVNGALIAPDIVLSAGHIALNHMDNLTLKVGPYAVHQREPFAETISVQEWLVQTGWRESAGGFFTNDFMIMKLATNSTHTPVRLNRNPDVPHPGDRVIMAGLGWTNDTYLSPANIVQEVELQTVSNEVCNAANDPKRQLSFQGKIDETMLCTTSPPGTSRDGCAWDSGAPVVVLGTSPETDVLVGLGSSGIGCADPIFPATQARVFTSLNWIEEQVCRLSTNPPPDFKCSPAEGLITTTTSPPDDTTTVTTTTTTTVSLVSPSMRNIQRDGSPPSLLRHDYFFAYFGVFAVICFVAFFPRKKWAKPSLGQETSPLKVHHQRKTSASAYDAINC